MKDDKPKETFPKVAEDLLSSMRKDYDSNRVILENHLKEFHHEEVLRGTTDKLLEVLKKEYEDSSTNLRTLLNISRKQKAAPVEEKTALQPPRLLLITIGLGLLASVGRKLSGRAKVGSKSGSSRSAPGAAGANPLQCSRSKAVRQAGESPQPQLGNLVSQLSEARAAKHRTDLDFAKMQSEAQEAQAQAKADKKALQSRLLEMDKQKETNEKEMKSLESERADFRAVVAAQESVIASLKDELDVCEQMMAELTSECVTGEISSTVNSAAQELVLQAQKHDTQVQEMRWRLSQLQEVFSPPPSDQGFLQLKDTLQEERDQWKDNNTFGQAVCSSGDQAGELVFKLGRKD
mmetsp:Transcript_13453/g.18415  ORF Transcript_13453/g.18415 Transcript_13453/m.18415 type:complete len:349 (+) Transcript_13453:304-1350(+)|eukprot:CAMPEP_0196589932 /NCGR_PEP_ID=MMETSP1081-20130531/65034_1 /TAXON_ID=36882 /ORGANISM="Pyramimonas amylifera, Strain CCMP720" /LENGTH=348 /DNA_ID=CAMNT_0041912875 /DNA_START=242 /DNA_END=1288 /DNA_ORIENTATION=-